MKDYRVETRIKNNRILQRIEDAGYESVAAFCRDAGLDQCRVGKILNMSAGVVTKKGEYTAPAKKIAELLGCPPDDLFTETQRYGMRKTFFIHELDEDEAIRLSYTSEETVERLVWERQRKEVVSRQIEKTLTPREAKVISLRYGYEGQEHTLDQIGDAMGISSERVRQIEAKAFRKFRNREEVITTLKEVYDDLV